MYMLYVCKNVYDLFLNRLLYFEFWMLNTAHSLCVWCFQYSVSLRFELCISCLIITVFSGKPRLFFKNFRVAAYIPVRLMCGRFQKTTHYTVHATACLDQHLITISSPTVLHNHWLIHWLSVQPCSHSSPARRVSLSLSVSVCVCVDAAVYCTHRQSVGKRPPDVPCWARSSGPLTHAGLWPTHVTHVLAWPADFRPCY